jgi:hypothetical protein
MKLFDIDWADFLERLTVWQQLSLQARQAFAQLHGNETVKTAAFHGQDRLLAEAGFIGYTGDGKLVRIEKACGPFARAIRAMLRHDLWNKPDKDTFALYLREHFTQEEQNALNPDPQYGYVTPVLLARQASSLGWLERFLEKSASHRGGSPHRGRTPAWLATDEQAPDSLKETQAMVHQFKEWPEPVPFHELPARFPDLPAAKLGVAIREGIAHLALFPTMRQEDMIPVLGLWPAIVARLHRPALAMPAAVRPNDVFHQAFLMEDMTSVLVAAAANPLRLKLNDGSLFAKVHQELETSLVTLPPWVVAMDRSSQPPRSDVAVTWLQALRLIRTTDSEGRLALEPTPRGRQWLSGNAKQRLKAVLDHLKEPGQEPPAIAERDDFLDDEDDEDYSDAYASFGNLNFVPDAVRFHTSVDQAALRSPLVKAYASLGSGGFFPLKEFVTWHVEQQNPLLKPGATQQRPSIYYEWSWQRATVEDLENAWEQVLLAFFRFRLLPLGGLRLGIAGERGSICIALTDVGRYLLGLANDFDHGPEHDGEGAVVVQPNFDVVFLAPSPLAEATIGRFAERHAKGVGTLLRITKKAILAAAAGGMTADQVLQTLRRLSSKPIPANVTREIQGWFDQCRRIIVRPAVLIRCPDHETATRVIGVLGNRVVPISETVLELRVLGSKSEVVRKLQSQGIFVDRLPSGGNESRRGER